MNSFGNVVIPSQERIQEDVQHLKEWISKEPHLPNVEGDEWLKTFLYNNKFSLEKTKFKLENYYSLRTKHPDVLKGRDPTAPELLRVREICNCSVSPKSEDGVRFLLFTLSSNANDFVVKHFTKRLFMILDALFLEQDRLVTNFSISDFKDASLTFYFKMMSGVPLISEIFDGAYTERVAAIHMYNAPSFIDKVYDVMRMYFPTKYKDRMFTHAVGSDTLPQMVDRKILPSDFGGDGPSLAKMDEYTQGLLEKHRKWFEEQETVCSNEQLRRKDAHQVEELKGSFRKLEVD